MLARYSHLSRGIALSALLILGLTACDDSPSLPADQVIAKAGPAMQGARSFHFNYSTTKPDKPLPGLFVASAEGDVVKPDKLNASVDASFGGLPIAVKVVVDGTSQYMTDPASGKWQVASPALNVMQFFDPGKGISDILAGVKNPTSDGTEKVDGANTYKIKGSVAAEALKSFSPEVTAQTELTTTLWVETSGFHLRRVKLQGPFSEGEPAGIERTITFGKYDENIKIETPVVEK